MQYIVYDVIIFTLVSLLLSKSRLVSYCVAVLSLIVQLPSVCMYVCVCVHELFWTLRRDFILQVVMLNFHVL